MLAFALLGCSSGAELSVDVVSDLAPAFELATLRVELREGGRVSIDEQPVSTSDDLTAGVRAAELSGLANGTYELRVAALDRDGRTLVSRPVTALVQGDTAITVLLTRSCAGVDCGDARACHGGSCVDPECTRENPAQCGSGMCTAAGDCDVSASCATTSCLDGACVEFSDSTSCGPMQWCNPDVGCVDGMSGDSGPADGAVDGAVDGGVDGGVDARPDCAMTLPTEITADFEIPVGCIVSVPESVTVLEGAFLTIRAGARVELDANVSIHIAEFADAPENAGGIEVLGTASDPVVFTTSASRPSAGLWDRLFLDKQLAGPSLIEHARFEWGGGTSEGALLIEAGITPGSLSVRDCVFASNLRGVGFHASSGFDVGRVGTFAEFARNTFEDNGAFDLLIPAMTLADVDSTNSFSGSIQLTEPDIEELVHWQNLGVAIYTSAQGIDIDSASAQLIVDPGVVVRFPSLAGIEVFGGTFTATDATFASALAAPGPGDWCGVDVRSGAGSVRIMGSTFQHAGSCTDGTIDIHYATEPFPVVTGTTFEMSGGSQNIFVNGSFAVPTQCDPFTSATPPNTFDLTPCATD